MLGISLSPIGPRSTFISCGRLGTNRRCAKQGLARLKGPGGDKDSIPGLNLGNANFVRPSAEVDGTLGFVQVSC